MSRNLSIIATAILTASCSTPEQTPADSQPVATPTPKPIATTPAPGNQQQTADNKTLYTASVTFRGFTPEALADFRIVPENGTTLSMASNGTHASIDGFWWRHSRLWFKIPDHCSVVVTAAPTPEQPSAFTTTHDCDALGTQIQKLRGLPHKPGFYIDEGNTGHGTDYPW